MTLGFSTKWPKQMGELAGLPNYFIQKIWMSIPDLGWKNESHEMYGDQHVYSLNKYWDVSDYPINAKPHTIRTGQRWKAGMKIHPVINNRTKNRFQFAPVLECKSVQDIEIKHGMFGFVSVWIDGIILGNFNKESFIGENTDCTKKIKELAINDGFPSVEAFFQYFNEDFKGQIIHWTDLKY